MKNSDFDIEFYEKSFNSQEKNNSKSYLDFDEIYQAPYIKYNEIINKIVSNKSIVLDLCVGDGIHSVKLAKISKNYTAIETSKSGLEILRSKLDIEGIKNYKLINKKIERFNSKSKFDFISIINSISYFDIKELIRIYNNNLKKGGTLIIIDSLKTNPIYRFNHLINFLKGKRSFKTINRIFTYSELNLYLKALEASQVKTYYFGSFLFFSIILRRIGLKRISKKISNYPKKEGIFDRYSFKFLTLITK